MAWLWGWLLWIDTRPDEEEDDPVSNEEMGK